MLQFIQLNITFLKIREKFSFIEYQNTFFSQKMQNVLAIYRQLIYTEKELRKFKEKVHILNKKDENT